MEDIRNLAHVIGENLMILCTYWVVLYGLIGQNVNYVPPALVDLISSLEDRVGMTGMHAFRNASGQNI
jgi:hypothetical protein